MTWAENFKKALDAKTIALVLAIGYMAGEKAWDLITKGAEVEFEQKVTTILEQKMKDPRMLRMVLNSKEVTEFSKEAGKTIRDNIIEDVMKKDTNKISMRAYFGKELDIRDESVLPLLKDLLKDYKEGKIATNKDVERIINKRVGVPSF